MSFSAKVQVLEAQMLNGKTVFAAVIPSSAELTSSELTEHIKEYFGTNSSLMASMSTSTSLEFLNLKDFKTTTIGQTYLFSTSEDLAAVHRRIDDFSYSLDPYDISKAPVMTRDEEGKVMVAGGVTLKTSLKQKMLSQGKTFQLRMMYLAVLIQGPPPYFGHPHIKPPLGFSSSTRP